MSTVCDYCENNPDFQQLLEKFKNGYIPIYNKRRVAARDEIKKFMNINFNTWYYSSEIVSPARFINSHIYNKIDSSAVVFPVCKPVFKKNKLMDMTYTFHVFTLDDHPFIHDLHLFLETVREIPKMSPMVQQEQEQNQDNEDHEDDEVDSVSTYIQKNISSFEKCEDLTFHERPYIATLGNVCEHLSLITFSNSKGSGPQILHHKKNIKTFFALPNRDKLERVITAMIEGFVKCFDYLPPDNRPDTADLLAALQEGQDIDYFLDNLFGLGPQFEKLFSLMGAEEPNAFVESADESEAKEILEAQDALSTCCSLFFRYFGQYLQLIQPEYDDTFPFTQADDSFLALIKTENGYTDNTNFKDYVGILLYLVPPNGYSLTTLGAGRLNKDLSRINNPWYPTVPQEQYQEILEALLAEDEEDMSEGQGDWPEDMLNSPEIGGDFLSVFADMLQLDMQDWRLYEKPDPLAGLNPDGLPVFTKKDAIYIFKTQRRTIELMGTETLADLSSRIQAEFDLSDMHMSSFYMGKKFFENKREITCPRFCLFDDDEHPTDAENYEIYQLNLYEKQKFLYLHDFIRENRFTITFAGLK
ncbi:MAG: plasmid pRiA4b ORF-3 family protein [Peptococcaceae bacterium]|nr:plasmid pRiA4b ORF-3 family protein [Peptococcaceae bacterium]